MLCGSDVQRRGLAADCCRCRCGVVMSSAAALTDTTATVTASLLCRTGTRTRDGVDAIFGRQRSEGRLSAKPRAF